jgi:hypothetical protein
LADINFWQFGALSFVWTWVLSFFFASLVPLSGVFFLYLINYLFISHYSQFIHALVLSLVSFFASLVGCFFLYLFIYLILFPTHTCPCTLSSFFFLPLSGAFSFIYLFNIIPNSYMPLYVLSLLSTLVLGFRFSMLFTIIYVSGFFFQLLNLCPVHGPLYSPAPTSIPSTECPLLLSYG